MSSATAPSRVTAPKRAAGVAKRPGLRVLPGGSGSRRRRVPEILAVLLVLCSLLLVDVGHSMLAQGQLRLGKINQSVMAEQALHRTTVLGVAALETPSRIAQEASTLKLVQPAAVLQLPTVSLDVPLPPPKVVDPAPTPPAAPTPVGTTSTPAPSTTTPPGSTH